MRWVLNGDRFCDRGFRADQSWGVKVIDHVHHCGKNVDERIKEQVRGCVLNTDTFKKKSSIAWREWRTLTYSTAWYEKELAFKWKVTSFNENMKTSKIGQESWIFTKTVYKRVTNAWPGLHVSVCQQCWGHGERSQDQEGIQRSTQHKQRPPHDLRCLLAAKMRGLHILTIIIAFCSFSINLARRTFVFVFFSPLIFPSLSSARLLCASVAATKRVLT